MEKIKKLFSVSMIVLAILLSSSQVQAGHFPMTDSVIVKQGDTLYRIAQKYHKNVQQLKEMNSLQSTAIYPGQRLMISKKDEQSFHKVIAGAFIDKDYAEKRISFLKQKGITAITTKKMINGKVYYRIQAGAFMSPQRASHQLQAVKNTGIEDAYLLEARPLAINGVTIGDRYEAIKDQFGEPEKEETRLANIKSLFYKNQGIGVQVIMNMSNGTIGKLTVYPEYLSTDEHPAIPFTKEQVIDRYGYPTDTEETACYETAKCQEMVYDLDGSQLKVRVDRNGTEVHKMELSQ